MALAHPERVLAKLEQLEGLREGAPAASSAAGKRRFKRFVVRGEAELLELHRPGSGQGSVSIALRDIGLGGIGFVSSRELESGQTWTVCFLNHWHVVHHATVLIRHCRPVDDGLFLTGAQFLIDPAIMLQLGLEPADVELALLLDRQAGFTAPGDLI